MAKGYGGKGSWQGKADSRPASSTAPKAQQHARENDKGVSWRGDCDSRPKSSPAAQTKVKLGGGG